MERPAYGLFDVVAERASVDADIFVEVAIASEEQAIEAVLRNQLCRHGESIPRASKKATGSAASQTTGRHAAPSL